MNGRVGALGEERYSKREQPGRKPTEAQPQDPALDSWVLPPRQGGRLQPFAGVVKEIKMRN